MGKILGKSALSLIGFTAACWLLLLLDKRILVWEASGVAGVIALTLLPYVYWFLLTAVYAFVLFRLFLKEKRCCLIVMLNGLFMFALFFAFWFARANSGVLSLVTQMAQSGGIAVMALALVFKVLISGSGDPAQKVPGSVGNAMRIILETIVGLGLFAILAFETYALSRNAFVPILAPFFQKHFLWLMAALIYASALYIFFHRHYHVILIVLVNAALLAGVWSLIFVPDALSGLTAVFPDFELFLCSLAGNTAILTALMALIYRRVERIYTAYRAEYRKSYAQHKMDDIGTII